MPVLPGPENVVQAPRSRVPRQPRVGPETFLRETGAGAAVGEALARGAERLGGALIQAAQAAQERRQQIADAEFGLRSEDMLRRSLFEAYTERSIAPDFDPDQFDQFAAQTAQSILGSASQDVSARARQEFSELAAAQRRQYHQSGVTLLNERRTDVATELIDRNVREQIAHVRENPDAFETSLVGLHHQIDRLSPILGAEWQRSTSLETEQALIQAQLQGYIDTGRADVARRLIESGIYDDDLKPETRQAMLDDAAITGVKDAVDEQGNKIKAYQDLLEGRMGELTRSQFDKAEVYARQRMNAYVTAANRLDAEHEKAEKKRQDGLANDAIRMLTERAPTQQVLDFLDANEDLMDASEWRALRKLAAQGPIEDDMNFMLTIEDMLDAGLDASRLIDTAAELGQVRTDTWLSLRRRNREIFSAERPPPVRTRARALLEGRFGRDLQFTPFQQISLLGIEALKEFDVWWERQIETTGQPPLWPQAEEKVDELTAIYLDDSQLDLLLEKIVSRPRSDLIVPDPANPTRLDAGATALRIAQEFDFDPESDPRTWPDEAKVQMRILNSHAAEMRIWESYIRRRGQSRGR